jgi:hypothetical protein
MISLILAALCALAQEKDAAKQQDPKVQDRLDDQEDRLKDLERKQAEMEKRQTQTTSANPSTVFNPTLTVAGDFLWRVDDRPVPATSDPTKNINDTINMREVELDLRASVDPFVEGVAIISVGSEIPGEFGVAVEEFYAVIKSLPLPFWETPPLGTKIKIGRFRTAFGLNNISHTHDLPQTDRPLAIEEFLGPDGQASNGISTQSFLPSPGDTALELTLQVLQGGSANIAQDNNSLCYLANLNWFVPLTDEHTLNVAAIGFYGSNDYANRVSDLVGSLDVLYKWKPLKQGEYESFLLGGQILYGRHENPLLAGMRTHPLGWTAWAQCQVSSRLYAGVRWDQTNVLTDDTLHRRKVSPYITWYTSEFFRARLTYEHTWSGLAVEDRLNSFFVELVVVFGAHPTEPFWVNK